ncbi:hypothetical protein ZWY2020_031500 [Hordeum vulgare]|nr:hypothetical protein ZWY2020_031500 [Hordeum vulgare]
MDGGSQRHRSGVETTELHDCVVAEEVKYVLKVSLELTRYDYYTVGTYDHDKKAMPRKVFLSRSGRQLIQWPVEEVKSLRSKHVNISKKAVRSGEYFVVTGFKSVQSDVEVVSTIRNLEKAEKFDPVWQTDAQGLCQKFHSHAKEGRHGIYKPTFAGFVNFDIAKAKKIALKTLFEPVKLRKLGSSIQDELPRNCWQFLYYKCISDLPVLYSDGVAAIVLVSEEKAKNLGLQVIARTRGPQNDNRFHRSERS